MRIRARGLLSVATLATVAATATASPAAAGGAPAAWCEEGNPFSSLGALTSGLAARGSGGELREPTLNATYQELPAAAAGKGRGGGIPVYFHVVTDGSIGAVSKKDIDRQITIMNLAFGGFYGGANTGFTFQLAGITRTDNAAWFYAGPGSREEREMKQALTRGAPQALNYYSTTAGPYLGWAYLPGLPNAQLYLDGIVVDWASMYKTSTQYEGRYDLGFTAVHEAGHWLDLEHTFWGGCTPHGDYVEDTPAMKIPTSGCPADGTKDTCPNDPGYDPIHNFMDYSYDACYYEFTPGQGQRMRDAFTFFRS